MLHPNIVSETCTPNVSHLLNCVISSARLLSYDVVAPIFVDFGLREPHLEMIDARSGGNGILLRVRETNWGVCPTLLMQIICQQPR